MSYVNEEITLNGVSQVILIYLFIAQVLGTCLNMLVVVAFFRSTSLFNANNLLTTNVFLAETIFGVTLSYFYTINIGQTENHISYVACQVTGTIVLTCACVMIFTLLLGAYYRYLIIVHDRPSLKVRTMSLILIGFWVFSPIFGLLAALADERKVDRHRPTNFGGACLPPYATRKPLGLAFAIISSLFIFLTPMHIVFAYYSIWQRLRQVHIQIKNMLNGGTCNQTIEQTDLDVEVPKGEQRIQTLREIDNRTEREILKRGVLISSLFFMGWCPVASILLYECISMNLAPYYIIGLAHMMLATHSFVSPLVVVTQDKMYRTAVLNVLSPMFSRSASHTPNPTLNKSSQTIQTSLMQSKKIAVSVPDSLNSQGHLDHSNTTLASTRAYQDSSREGIESASI